ncbi:3-hydroxyacyl-ACP dehydratase FabZ family protein [Streptomyces sp. MH13]|uniref:3-hydroxyacyl-ACP dehydratase FabZ family protein n=1 Tax=unclassified Streptomyces TaxID=2593676 RepID=UPI003CE7BE8D
MSVATGGHRAGPAATALHDAPGASAPATATGGATVVSPVAARIVVESRTGEGLAARATAELHETEPVFAGHYPGFPIFPGVCVLECVRRAALDADPASAPGTLAAVESARFSGAVYPGDTLQLALTWQHTGTAWRCKATATTSRGPAARVRLRFEPAGGAR